MLATRTGRPASVSVVQPGTPSLLLEQEHVMEGVAPQGLSAVAVNAEETCGLHSAGLGCGRPPTVGPTQVMCCVAPLTVIVKGAGQEVVAPLLSVAVH